MERNKYLVCNVKEMENDFCTYDNGMVFDTINDAIFYIFSKKNKTADGLYYHDVLRYDSDGWFRVVLKPSDKAFPSSSHKMEKIKIIEPNRKDK